MGMLDLALLVIRGFQFLFALIVVAIMGHFASEGATASQINFLIFVAAWTMLILLYLALAPRFFASLANVFAILALDALTMLFWFAGFIAAAVLYHRVEDSAVVTYVYFGGYVGEDTCDYDRSFCREFEAAVVFGAFEWALFVVSTVLAALSAMRNRNKGTTAGGV